MEEIRFRNHFSVVFEHLLGFLAILVVLMIQNLNELSELTSKISDLRNGLTGKEELAAILVPAGLLVLALIIIGIQINVWSKTWITITADTIVEERNTLNKVCNTIGIRNISNVNLEQNIAGKIFGTCKVKLDTNSLSTANDTDIKIVLKKNEAIAIQKKILSRVNMNQEEQVEAEQNDTQQDAIKEDFDFVATNKDIMIHGICSMSVFSIFVLVGGITGVVTAFHEFGNEIGKGTVVSILANLVIIAGIIFSCMKGIFGGFITYHDFKIKRQKDRLVIHYGLLRTIDYTIPVSKINAVIIHQTLIGRFLGKYMVELVNVGMGDEDTESGAYMILACGKKELKEQLQLLLPEYADISIEKITRQPKEVIWNKLVKTIIWSVIIFGAGFFAKHYIPVIQTWMVLVGGAIMVAFGILLSVLQYLTAGSYFDENGMVVANGCFQKKISVMPYDKIQYLEINTNVVLNHFGLVKGNANLLAALSNQTQQIPVCRANDLEKNCVSIFLQTDI